MLKQNGVKIPLSEYEKQFDEYIIQVVEAFQPEINDINTGVAAIKLAESLHSVIAKLRRHKNCGTQKCLERIVEQYNHVVLNAV